MVKKQKGVTLVETVIALALISIVSATVFFTCDYSIKMQNNNRVKNYFINETENVLMCYYSGNLDNFQNSLSFLVGTNIDIDDEAVEYNLYYTSDFNYTTQENAIYSLNINYQNEISPRVICKNLSTDKNIYVFGGEDDA